MTEIRALKKVFKDPSSIYVNSTKSMVGHLLGGAGAVEAIATVQTILQEVAHPTINLEDPEADIDFYVSNKAHKLRVRHAMSNSFGFGGHNASIILSPYHP